MAEGVKTAMVDESSYSVVENACAIVTEVDIRSRIFTIRGVQVMLDRDLSELYQVATKALNQAVKRNSGRFPEQFCFHLTKNEMSELVTNCDRFATLKHSSALMTAFTEQGIAMLSAVLRSDVAVGVSVRIMSAFVEMRKTLASLAPLVARIDTLERRQLKQQELIETDEANIKLIFDAMQDKSFPPQKIFYDGQVYDAKAFATKHILSAAKSIFLIDSWVDVATLEMLAKKKPDVTVEIVTSPRGNRLAASDIAAFNAQYGGLAIRTSTAFHDRFLIVDDKRLYLFGASLKDLGKKCFAFTKLDPAAIPELEARAAG